MPSWSFFCPSPILMCTFHLEWGPAFLVPCFVFPPSYILTAGCYSMLCTCHVFTYPPSQWETIGCLRGPITTKTLQWTSLQTFVRMSRISTLEWNCWIFEPVCTTSPSNAWSILYTNVNISNNKRLYRYYIWQGNAWHSQLILHIVISV